MNTVLVGNEKLAITLPEGFEEIPHKELESLIGITYDSLWGVRDTNRHMLMYVTWKDSNKLLVKLASEKSGAKRVDKQFSKCRPGSGYASETLPNLAISGSDAGAEGFRFSYNVKDPDGEGTIKQDGEVRIFKRDVRYYTLVYYTRGYVANENRPVFDAILNSIEVR